ncbi:phage portal protein, partial [Salmonella enterica]|nr:phage portal protein [Salmonella enterica]EIM7020581.1 phage portal protein [Salmonella enterica]EIZ0758889.1 phage portal protein [Salmonella enterica]EJU7649946.1 phage portal protein [Salmonella enterica]ELX9190618.1 phage portal protein [Salmonella enterica]
MSRKNRKKSYNRGDGVGFEQALKSDPALSAFTFDGPYRVSGFDLLDNMYCADNGR